MTGSVIGGPSVFNSIDVNVERNRECLSER
jgi:hypothetical protein